MKHFSRLFGRIHNEEDPWSLIAIFIAFITFVVCLGWYYFNVELRTSADSDILGILIAASIVIIFFVLTKILAITVHWLTGRKKEKPQRDMFKSLGIEEKAAVKEFVDIGREYMIRQEISDLPRNSVSGMESLLQREIIRHSPTSGYKSEVFVLNRKLYNYARKPIYLQT